MRVFDADLSSLCNLYQETVLSSTTQHKTPDDMAALDQTLDPDITMTTVYIVLESIGFDCLECQDAKDEATALFIKNYVKFRQGEIWQDIRKEFLETGMKPTAPDRCEMMLLRPHHFCIFGIFVGTR